MEVRSICDHAVIKIGHGPVESVLPRNLIVDFLIITKFFFFVVVRRN